MSELTDLFRKDSRYVLRVVRNGLGEGAVHASYAPFALQTSIRNLGRAMFPASTMRNFRRVMFSAGCEYEPQPPEDDIALLKRICNFLGYRSSFMRFVNSNLKGHFKFGKYFLQLIKRNSVLTVGYKYFIFN